MYIYTSSVFLLYKVCWVLWGRERSAVTPFLYPGIDGRQHKPERLRTVKAVKKSVWQFRTCYKAIISCCALGPVSAFQMHLDYTLKVPPVIYHGLNAQAFVVLSAVLQPAVLQSPPLTYSCLFSLVRTAKLWSRCQCLLFRGKPMTPLIPRKPCWLLCQRCSHDLFHST